VGLSAARAERLRLPFDSHGTVWNIGEVATPLDGLFEPFSRCFDAESARRVAEFRVDPAVQARIDEERTEYEAFLNAADFISILKLKARRHLGPAAFDDGCRGSS
jgi:hypothetical protein